MFSRASGVLTALRTVFVSARTRWNGVFGASYFFVIFAPLRVLEVSFCFGPKWLVRSDCNAQIWFNSSSSLAVS